MPEPLTTVGIGAIAAYLGKDGLSKILGPTADYLGGELQEFTKKRINNVGRIFQNAEIKLGDKVEEPGGIPPKVLKTIINEGSYSEDQITVEYFGGVLASSRSEFPKDDRGARIAKLLDNLSSYQLTSHYLIYSTISNLFEDQPKSLSSGKERMKLEIIMPLHEFANSIGVSQKEWDNPQLLTHIFHGLSSDDLISENWAFGPIEGFQNRELSRVITEPSIVCTPSSKGTELFLWGFGKGDKDLDYIFSQDFSCKIQGIKSQIPKSYSTKT